MWTTAGLSAASADFSVCHASDAHFTRTGNSRTPANAASLPMDSSSTGWPTGVVTIAWKRSNNEIALLIVPPLTASVISDAEAFEIAQPDPSNEMAAIRSPSILR